MLNEVDFLAQNPCESNFTFHTISQSFVIFRDINSTKIRVFLQELTDKFHNFGGYNLSIPTIFEDNLRKFASKFIRV